VGHLADVVGRNRLLTALLSSGLPVQGKLHLPAGAKQAARSFGSVVCERASLASQSLQVATNGFGEAANVTLRQILLQQGSEVYQEALFSTRFI
jgi:hypothetical protein